MYLPLWICISLFLYSSILFPYFNVLSFYPLFSSGYVSCFIYHPFLQLSGDGWFNVVCRPASWLLRMVRSTSCYCCETGSMFSPSYSKDHPTSSPLTTRVTADLFRSGSLRGYMMMGCLSK